VNSTDRHLAGNGDGVTDAAVGRRADPVGMATSGRIGAEQVTAEGLSPGHDGKLVAGLYHEHGLALVRTAMLLVGDKPTAEDIVQDAFAGLQRALPRLESRDNALAYLRVSVVNGCRSVHRTRRTTLGRPRQHEVAVWSAEAAAMAREDTRLTLRAVARLPRRSREVLALRYYLDLTDLEIAQALGVSRGTVSSTASRALAALHRELKEEL
jgi:RNA polymerase sigma factor (sigma-70 family)